ncbi:MAG: diacylglycerol kinase family protein [Eubacteriales bacterium]
MKYIFIINPVAGKNNKIMGFVPRIQKICKKYKLNYTIHISESGEGIRTYLQSECSRRADSEEPQLRVYALGGDGTLSHVVNGCMGYKHIEVGVIPLGTGNDFIRNFKGGAETYLSIEKQILAESAPIDLIKFEEEYCINMINMGLDARVCMDMPRFKQLPLVNNKGAYNLSLFYHLMKKLGRYMEIYADDKLMYKGKIALCAISNGISCGGGFFLTPHAKVNDGFIDIAYVKVPHKTQLPKILKHIKEGTQFQEEPTKNYMKTIRCKKVRIVTKQEAPLVYDGELYTLFDQTFSIVQGGISFIQP